MRRISYIFCLLCFANAAWFIQADRSQVWVLHDEDALDVASSSAARDACMRSFRPLGYETDYIPIETLLCEERNWDACALLVIPGGQTTKIEEKMGDKGKGILEAFHEKGGHCLGICGGAFLLSQTTQYEGVSSGDILHRYALAPVHSKGPYPGGEPRCLPVSVWQEGKHVRSLNHLEAWWAHGGVMEVPSHSLSDGDKLDVIARYNPGRVSPITEDSISILKYQPSSGGQVILSHVHIEYPRSSGLLWDRQPICFTAANGHILRSRKLFCVWTVLTSKGGWADTCSHVTYARYACFFPSYLPCCWGGDARCGVLYCHSR